MSQVPLVPEARGETEDPREELVSLDRKGKRGTRVGQGCRGPEERRAPLDHQDYQGSKVCLAHGEAQGPRAPEGQGAGQDLRGLRVSQAWLGSLAEMDSLVLRGHRDQQVSEDQWGQLGSWDRGGQ